MPEHTTSFDEPKVLQRILERTTEFDAMQYLTTPAGRYGFLLEALEPPLSAATLKDALQLVLQSVGGVEALSAETGVPSALIESGVQASTAEQTSSVVTALLHGLRRHVPAPQLAA